MVAGPAFGCAQNSLSYSDESRADFIELIDGYDRHRFFRKKDRTVSEQTETLDCYGIRGSGDATYNPFEKPLTEVSQSEEEEVIFHESWNQVNPNTDIDTQGKALVGVDAMLIIRCMKRWTVAGKGDPPDRTVGVPWEVGDDVNSDLEIGPATGGANPSFTITIPTGAQLESISKDAENTDFKNFRMEFTLYVPQTADDATTHILSVPDFVNSVLPQPADLADKYVKIRKTSSLSADNFARIVNEVEIHEPQDLV